jgi:hypothetical protein
MIRGSETRTISFSSSVIPFWYFCDLTAFRYVKAIPDTTTVNSKEIISKRFNTNSHSSIVQVLTPNIKL